MTDQDLLQRYNYDAFVKENFEPWNRFDDSPPLSEKLQDFPLWRLEDRSETSLAELWRAQRLLVVEFGSFT